MSRSLCDCSLIIPTRNRREVLETTLARIARLPDRGFEVLVLDNGSEDGTRRLCASFPSVRWIELGQNRGAAARNVGAEKAAGRILFMLDDDSWPLPGVIETLVKRFDTRPDLGAIACRVLLANEAHRHDAGGVPGIFFNCGGAVQRDAFLQTGGYPIEYEYYAEEYDVCCKLWQAGFRVEPHGDLVVKHHRTSLNRDNNRMLRLLVRNNVMLWERYGPENRVRDLVDSTIERYRRVAVREGALAGFERGLMEARQFAHNRPIDSVSWRRPLTGQQFDSLFGIERARRVLREWRERETVRRVGVWSRGKGCEQLIELINSLGIEIEGVYDSTSHIGAETRWRDVALYSEEMFEPSSVDGLIAGSLSPGVAEDLRSELMHRFAGTPVNSAAPWMYEDGCGSRAVQVEHKAR